MIYHSTFGNTLSPRSSLLAFGFLYRGLLSTFWQFNFLRLFLPLPFCLSTLSESVRLTRPRGRLGRRPPGVLDLPFTVYNEYVCLQSGGSLR